MAKLEAVKALGKAISARFETYTKDGAFGPLSSMTLETMPTPGEMWDMMQKASKGRKIGAEFFTKFLHWLYVKMLSKKIEEMKSLDDIGVVFGICFGNVCTLRDDEFDEIFMGFPPPLLLAVG
jgi:hypothetical protein